MESPPCRGFPLDQKNPTFNTPGTWVTQSKNRYALLHRIIWTVSLCRHRRACATLAVDVCHHSCIVFPVKDVTILKEGQKEYQWMKCCKRFDWIYECGGAVVTTVSLLVFPCELRPTLWVTRLSSPPSSDTSPRGRGHRWWAVNQSWTSQMVDAINPSTQTLSEHDRTPPCWTGRGTVGTTRCDHPIV